MRDKCSADPLKIAMLEVELLGYTSFEGRKLLKKQKANKDMAIRLAEYAKPYHCSKKRKKELIKLGVKIAGLSTIKNLPY